MSPEFWLSIAGMLFGVGVVGCAYFFGRNIYWSKWHEFDHWFAHIASQGSNSRAFKEAVEDYLGRRNNFWELFGQVALSVVVVVFLSVLLLMDKIQADAGLPILSAVVAFVVGKGIGGRDRAANVIGSGADDA